MAKSNPRKAELLHRRDAPFETRTDLTREATRDISGAMNAILADVFALYLKTKNFHWHMSGHHFRDYHLLLDEHAEQLFAMTDVIAERVRKIGGSPCIRSERSRVLSECWITMLNTSSRWTCSPSWRTTTRRSPRVSAKRTTCATNIVTSRRQVSSKYGSMKPSVARGSCSKPHAKGTDLLISRTRRRLSGLKCGPATADRRL